MSTDRPAPDPAERVEELRAQITYHNQKYHQLDAPEISDGDYDALVQELRAIEEEHPDLLTPDSPTQTDWPCRSRTRTATSSGPPPAATG